MGNTQSNRVEDRKWASGPEGYPVQVTSPAGSKGIELINAQQMIGLGENNGKNASKQDRYKNKYDLEMSIQAQTWYRDSHGLFDYEEKEKLTLSNMKVKDNFVLQRHDDTIIPNKFDDFKSANLNYKRLEEECPEQKIAATCLFKDNNYWMYHRFEIDTAEDEKANPGDKLWLVMRHMGNDRDHNFQPGQGYKLDIGDTIKFGRVRYKVIMMHSEIEGLQEYNIGDRFMRQRFNASLRMSQPQSDKKIKKKKKAFSSSMPDDQASNVQGLPQMRKNPSAVSGVTVQTDNPSTMAGTNLQAQNTHFDGVQIRGRSFDDSDLSESSLSSNQNRDMVSGSQSGAGDGVSSSEYMTESEDANEFVDIRVAPIDVDMENVATVNQLQENQQPQIPQTNVNAEQVSPNGQTNVEMQFSPPYADPEASGHENAFERERQNTNVDQNLNNPNLRTGTLWFNPPSNVVTSSHPDLGVNNEINVNPNPGGHDARKQSVNVDPESKNQSKKRRKKSLKQKKAQAKKLILMQKAKLAAEQKVCRICLGEENEGEDPLISPCKCAGTMSHIHLECLREWLNSKRSKKEGECVKTYCWKALECELCKQRFPGQVFSDGSIVTDDEKVSKKRYERMGKPIEILEYELPDKDFIVLESVTLQNIRIVHVINMKDREYIRVGRGHDADIRVTDISVSRFHARINRDPNNGQFYVEDNKSKFGTLIQIRKPIVLQKNINNYIQMGRTTLTVMIKDEQLAELNKKQEISCLQNPFTYCCMKSKKPFKMFAQTMQQELYPSEWDPYLNQKNKDTETEDKQLNTQGVDQTRDEANISHGNPSPSPRALSPANAPRANDSINRENSEILDLGPPIQRIEESKQNDGGLQNFEDQNSSLVNEPQIAGAFNSVEQNLIAIESSNVERQSESNGDVTLQGRHEQRFVHEMNMSQVTGPRSFIQAGPNENVTQGDINMTTNIKADGTMQINTGGEYLASPVKALPGENESPGPITSMKYGSEQRGDMFSNTEKLDPNNTHDNQQQLQEVSGIFSKTLDNQQISHDNEGNMQNSLNNITSQQQMNNSMIGTGAIGTGLLNQTTGSIEDKAATQNINDPTAAAINLNQSEQHMSQSPNVHSSVNDQNISQDAQLPKTDIIGANNPKLVGLSPNNANIDVSQNLSVFDMTNNQVGVNGNDLSQSQILSNLDQTQQQPISPNAGPTGKMDGAGKGQQNDTSLLGLSPGEEHGRNYNGSAVTGNQIDTIHHVAGQESLVQELKNLNLPVDTQQPAQVEQLQALEIPQDEEPTEQVGSNGADESETAQLAQLEIPKK